MTDELKDLLELRCATKKMLYLRAGAFWPGTGLLSQGSVPQEREEEEGDPPVEVHPVSGSDRELSRISVV